MKEKEYLTAAQYAKHTNQHLSFVCKMRDEERYTDTKKVKVIKTLIEKNAKLKKVTLGRRPNK